MKRVDRLIVGEMIGPWFFGVTIFSVLIMAGSFLYQITDYVARGIGFTATAKFTALLLPGVVTKTFPMSVLLATLLAFGRLSSDSEVVAMRAAGISVWRMMRPVAAFGFAVAILTFYVNEIVVPGAAMGATVLKEEIRAILQEKRDVPTYYAIKDEGRTSVLIVAKNFDIAESALDGAYMVGFDESGESSFYMYAKRLEYTDESRWRIRGGGWVSSDELRTRVIIPGDAYPEDFSTDEAEVENPDVTPVDLIARNLRDMDALSMKQTREQIDRSRSSPSVSDGQVAQLQFGYWNKVAIPLSAFVFGLVGAPLAIRSHRTSAASGFWLSIIIIFSYTFLANMMAIYARAGSLPAIVASFLPVVLGVIAASVLIFRRNS